MQTHHLQYYAPGKTVHKKPVVEFYLQPVFYVMLKVLLFVWGWWRA